jgi:hypothetical protein
MAGIEEFFVSKHDTEESVPPTSAGNVVTYLIDGDNYFHALREDVMN